MKKTKKMMSILLLSITANYSLALERCDDYKGPNGDSFPASQCCPLEKGESPNNACKFEQQKVKNLLSRLEKKTAWVYKDEFTKRGPIMFSDKSSGQDSKQMFIDAFVKVKNGNRFFTNHYLVKNNDGSQLYTVYRDSTDDGVVNIDGSLITDQYVPVVFDSLFRPSFALRFLIATEGPIKTTPTIEILSHYDDRAEFTTPDGEFVQGYDFVRVDHLLSKKLNATLELKNLQQAKKLVQKLYSAHQSQVSGVEVFSCSSRIVLPSKAPSQTDILLPNEACVKIIPNSQKHRESLINEYGSQAKRSPNGVIIMIAPATTFSTEVN